MIITQELQYRVEKKIRETIVKYFGVTSNLNIPVSYRTDMKGTAGLAYKSSRRIELNVQLLLENTEDFFKRTIPHEVAHIIQYMVYPYAKQGHGPEWREIMDFLGVDSTRCHSYDVSALVVKRNTTKFTYGCSCEGKVFNISKLIHNKIQSGAGRHCLKCKTVVYKL